MWIRPSDEESKKRGAPLAQLVGRSRFVVLLPALAVLVVAISLFLLGTYLAGVAVWVAWSSVLGGEIDSTQLTVHFLEVVSVRLKAVVFYLIGIGFYSLFIAPLNLPVALGVETLNDLETKVISVVVVLMAVNFLEHFIVWKNSLETLQHGVALAVVVAALVLFQFYNHRATGRHHPNTQTRAKRELFEENVDKHEVQLPSEEPARSKQAFGFVQSK